MSKYEKLICVDFDGVIHSYKNGWKGIDIVADEPVSGAFDWLERLVKDVRFKVCIYSSRSKEQAGIKAMKQWFRDYGFDSSLLEEIEFPSQKPAAFITIDDRALCFTGVFPSLSQIDTFRPWYKND